MKIRGYVVMALKGYQIVDTLTPELAKGALDSGARVYTFEVDVPHPLPELKVIGESVEEVGRDSLQVKSGQEIIQ